MRPDLPLLVAAPAHPSLDGAVVRFADALRAETAGPGDAEPPTPALVGRLAATTPGLRLAAVHDGEIVGLARIDDTAPIGPELLVAVAAPWRRRGVGRALAQAIVARAHSVGIERLVLHTSRRTPGLRALGRTIGFRAVDLGGGRVDLVRTVRHATRSA